MLDQKDYHECDLQVIEIELGNKCVETLKKYQGRLSEHSIQCLFNRIRLKAEN